MLASSTPRPRAGVRRDRSVGSGEDSYPTRPAGDEVFPLLLLKG
jgi:hypothetical protein